MKLNLGFVFQHTAARRRLGRLRIRTDYKLSFQHTAARRRLGIPLPFEAEIDIVSTHSRPKAAGLSAGSLPCWQTGFNTQPPEGGWLWKACLLTGLIYVSTHSRPKAAGSNTARDVSRYLVSTHSRPKAAGWEHKFFQSLMRLFQHTAARRRLA